MKKRKLLIFGLFIIVLIPPVTIADFEQDLFWSRTNDTIVLTNTTHNVNIGENDTTIYKLNVNGTSNFNDTVTTANDIQINYNGAEKFLFDVSANILYFGEQGLGNIEPLIAYDTGVPYLILYGGDAVSGSNADGNSVQLSAGTGDSSGDGGDIGLTSGNAGASGDGGDVSIISGYGLGAGSYSGDILIATQSPLPNVFNGNIILDSYEGLINLMTSMEGLINLMTSRVDIELDNSKLNITEYYDLSEEDNVYYPTLDPDDSFGTDTVYVNGSMKFRDNTWTKGEILGDIQCLSLGNYRSTLITTSASHYLTNDGVTHSASKGFPMWKEGSITGLSVMYDVTAQSGNYDLEIRASRNGFLVWSNDLSGSTGNNKKDSFTQARNTDTFRIGDAITVYLYNGGTIGTSVTVNDVIIIIEIITD